MWGYRRSYADGTGVERTRVSRWSVVDAIARFTDLVFSLVYGLLTTRLVLDFFLAKKETGFYQFLLRISEPFYWPFKDIVPTTIVADVHPVVWSLIVAMLAFSVLHALIRGLLRAAARN